VIDSLFWHNKTVLITGHTGFKGSWLMVWLHMLGAKIIGVSLEPEHTPNMFSIIGAANLGQNFYIDIRNLKALSSVLQKHKPEIVIHMAAQSLVRYSYERPIETYETNVMGSLHLLEAIRQIDSVQSVVMVTTDKCYKNIEQQKGYVETDPMGGFDPYSSSKACMELMVDSMRNSFFLDGNTLVATARAGNVIGGGDWAKDRLVPDLIQGFATQRSVIIRNPAAIRPWQHVLEPLHGYLLLAEKLYSGNSVFASSWNFGPNESDNQTVNAVADKLCALWGKGAKWVHDQSEQPHEANMLMLNSNKAKKELGWKPALNIDETLELVIEWYKAFHKQEGMLDITRSQISKFNEFI